MSKRRVVFIDGKVKTYDLTLTYDSWVNCYRIVKTVKKDWFGKDKIDEEKVLVCSHSAFSINRIEFVR